MTKITNTLIKKAYFLLYGLLLSFPALADDFEQHCPTLQDYKTEGQEFWLRGSYEVIAKTCAQLAEGSWALFATSLQAIVAIGIGIYIAMYTLRNLGAFSQQDVSAYLSNDKRGVIPLLFKGAFIILLLSDKAFVYKYLISPIIVAGAEIGGSGWGTSFGSDSSVRGLFTKVINTAEDFNNRAYEIVAMGRMLLCLMKLPSFPGWYWQMIPFGATAYIFGQMIILGIAFYMMDLLFRLGVGCIMLPMGIACGVSKYTSHYTRQLWNLFINVAFNFIILGIVVNFTISMIQHAMIGLVAQKVELFISATVMTKAQIDQLAAELTLTAFVMLALCCIIAFKLFLSVGQIADKVSSTSSVGHAAVQTAAQVAKTAYNETPIGFAIEQVTPLGGDGLSETGKAFVGEIGATVANSKPVRSVGSAYNSFREAGKRAIGLDDAAGQDRWGNWIKKQAKRILRVP